MPDADDLPANDPDPQNGGPAAARVHGASQLAADAIREMIVSGEVKQSGRLPPERVLAQKLGFSRSSVREAVRELSALGILTVRQGAGTYVTSLASHELFAPLEFALRVDDSSLLHLTELRLVLEPHVAAMASARLDTERAAVLQEALRGYEREVEGDEPDPAVLIELDEKIHATLVDAAGNPLIAAVVRSLDSVVRRGREVTVVMRSAPSESLTELRALVDAVTSRDPARAHASMTWHLARWAERLRREVDGNGASSGADAPPAADANP